jgi:hypothetical protein
VVAARDRVRVGDRAELAAAVVFLVGLLASAVHWSGLLLGGALLGLVASSVRRATLTGTYLGVFVLFSFGLYLFVVGALSAYLSMGVLLLASVGFSVGLPALAAGAVRGLT